MNDDQTEVVVQENGESDATWDDFCAKLPDDDCRYAVFDFDYTLEDGGQRDKVILVVWYAADRLDSITRVEMVFFSECCTFPSVPSLAVVVFSDSFSAP